MIIIALMNILFYYLAKKYGVLNNKKTRIILLAAFAFEILLLLIYRLNLSLIGREVYFSDAETYWKNTMEVLNFGYSEGYNNVYYSICALIQKTSPFIWVGWNNLFNICCLNFSILLSLICISENEHGELNKRLLIILTAMNPFIVYGLMRNLKDALFMLMAFLTFFITDRYFKLQSKIAKVVILATLIALSYLFTSIRPWAFVIPIVSIFYIIQKHIRDRFRLSRKSICAMILALLLIGAAIIFLVPSIYDNIRIWAPIVFGSVAERNPIASIFGIGRFILAPGPVRSFMGDRFFEHYTISGNIMAGIGSIMWWGSLAFMLYAILTRKLTLRKNTDGAFPIILAITTSLMAIIYTLQYGGAAEIRIKSIFYVFVLTLFFQFYDAKKPIRNKKLAVSATAILLLMFIVISVASMGMQL